MVSSFESISEQLWTEATEQLRGKLEGTRVLVWVNFDLISLHKIFYLVEKGAGRVVSRDFPLPVFWDEELPLARRRLEQLHEAIDTFTFSDLPPFAISNSDEDWDTWGDEPSIEEDDISMEDESIQTLSSVDTENSESGSSDDSESIVEDVEIVVDDAEIVVDEDDMKEWTEAEAVERIRQQLSMYTHDEQE